MESTWYLFPGQTLANTKISDRSHALHIRSKEWGKITSHLDRKKLKEQAIQREREHKQYLDDGSKRMIQNWENSLENIRKRKEEERLKHKEQKKEDRNQKFFELREEQEKIRKDYVDKMRKQIYMNTGNARELTSAFVTSEILYEREKQKDFKKLIDKHYEEEAAKYAQVVKENAEKELLENREKELKKRKKNKDHGDYLKQEIAQKSLRQQEEKQKQTEKEALDNIRAMEEMECLEKKLLEKKAKNMQELFGEKKKLLKQEEEKKIQLAKEESELDAVVAIYKETKHRIDCMKKAREKELRDEAAARQEAVAKLVMAHEKAKTEVEEERMKAAIAEKDAIEKKKLKKRAEYDKKMKEERFEDRKKFIEHEEVANKKQAEIRKWEMLNRYKTDEILKKYEESKRKQHWKKVLEYRKELLEQMSEEKALLLQEKEIEEFVTRSNFHNDDDSFFEYADEVLKLAKKRGRSTYPIEKVIMQYKKTNLLLPDKCEDNCENYITSKEAKSMSQQIFKKSQKNKNDRSCRCRQEEKKSVSN
ncbi:unnamed protein product [Phaedon cochleariae]|uniref:Trichohyalin-plectin-homology domain-containing protein n=1 Tax=Phaedon cochleariae TaxID=80249 RepID=A0A9P0D8M8_PHACE|nr:unnamed protein product [Phaedon cochleariae]